MATCCQKSAGLGAGDAGQDHPVGASNPAEGMARAEPWPDCTGERLLSSKEACRGGA